MTDKQKVDALFEHMYKKRTRNKIIFYSLVIAFYTLFFIDIKNVPSFINYIFMGIATAIIIWRFHIWLKFVERVDYNDKYNNFGIIRTDEDFDTYYNYGFDMFLYNERITDSKRNLITSLDPSSITYFIKKQYDEVFTSNSKRSSIANEYYKQLK